MTADQALATLRTLLAQIADWARLFAFVIFSVLLLGTLCSMAGYPIPYVTAIRADMMQLGVLTAGMAFALWKK